MLKINKSDLVSGYVSVEKNDKFMLLPNNPIAITRIFKNGVQPYKTGIDMFDVTYVTTIIDPENIVITLVNGNNDCNAMCFTSGDMHQIIDFIK